MHCSAEQGRLVSAVQCSAVQCSAVQFQAASTVWPPSHATPISWPIDMNAPHQSFLGPPPSYTLPSCTALCCAVQFYIKQHCTILHCTVLKCTALYYTALSCRKIHPCVHFTVLCILHLLTLISPAPRVLNTTLPIVLQPLTLSGPLSQSHPQTHHPSSPLISSLVNLDSCFLLFY